MGRWEGRGQRRKVRNHERPFCLARHVLSTNDHHQSADFIRNCRSLYQTFITAFKFEALENSVQSCCSCGTRRSREKILRLMIFVFVWRIFIARFVRLRFCSLEIFAPLSPLPCTHLPDFSFFFQLPQGQKGENIENLKVALATQPGIRTLFISFLS